MKTQIITIGLCLFACLMVQGQMPTLEWGKPIKRSSSQEHRMIGSDGEHHWTLDYRIKATTFDDYVELNLKKFDQDLKLVKSVELPIQFEGNNLIVNKAILNDNTIWVFFQTFDLAKRQNILWVEGYNKNDLEKSRKAQKIQSLPLSNSLIKIRHSPNYEYFLLHSKQQNNTELFNPNLTDLKDQLTVLDSRFDFLWQTSLSYKALNNLHINNEGLIIGSAIKNNSSGRARGILILEDEGQSKTFLEMGTDTSSVQTFMVNFIDKEHLFAFAITEDKMLYTQKVALANKESIWKSKDQLYYKRKDKLAHLSNWKNSGSLTKLVNTRFKPPLLATDGAVYIFGEDYNYTDEGFFDTTDGPEKGRVKALYGNIHVFRLSPTGELDWEKNLPKGQQLTGLYMRTRKDNTSFNAFISPEQNLVFIFNDCARNYLSPTEYKPGCLYTGNLADAVSLCELSSDGKATYRMLYSYHDRAYGWAPNSVLALKEGRYIMYGFRNKRFCMAYLSW